MNYLLKNKPKHLYRGKIIFVVGLFVVLSLCAFLFPNALRSLSYGISKPLWFVENIVVTPFSKIKDLFAFKSSLISENAKLKEKIVSLELRQIDHGILFKENQDLKAELGRTENSRRIIARVLSKPPRSPYDTFVLDAGSSDSVSLGSKVYYSDNVVIGSVTNITPHTSLVELFSTGGRKQEATDLRTGASFVLVGRGGANLSIEVPKDTDIVEGDVFIYPDLSSSVIGTAYHIDTNSQSAFKTIYIRIPGNVFASQSVFIEKI